MLNRFHARHSDFSVYLPAHSLEFRYGMYRTSQTMRRFVVAVFERSSSFFIDEEIIPKPYAIIKSQLARRVDEHADQISVPA